MIPELTLNISSIKLKWENSLQAIDFTRERCTAYHLCKEIPVYFCDEEWVKLGIYKESKTVLKSLLEYGYCDTEEALKKFLTPYKEARDKKYFVRIYLLSMNYEKYYKHGYYINSSGKDTGQDYYSYLSEHPEEKINQEYENYWIAFNISEID